MGRFKRAFGAAGDIRPGEWRLILPLALAYTLVMASLYVLKPVRNALFLDGIGIAQLPYVLLLVALVGGGTAALFSRFTARIGLSRLVPAVFAVLILCLVAFRLLLPQGLAWSYYLFYVWVNIYGLMATSLLWLLAGTLFNARQARRLFGVIGAAGIVGAILGGGVTTGLVEVVGTENLLLLCAGMLVLCLGGALPGAPGAGVGGA